MELLHPPLPSPVQALRQTYLQELTGPTTRELLAAEAQSVRYWRSNALGYSERVVDGFYEVHGEFAEVCPPGRFPHLAALMQVGTWGSLGLPLQPAGLLRWACAAGHAAQGLPWLSA